MNILQYVLHLWAGPPVGLQLTCPRPADGQNVNLIGYFDDASVRAAFDAVAGWSAVAVLVVILYCYMATRQASGPRFDRRWVFALIGSALACAGVAYVVLHTANTTAMAQSCQTNPSAFAIGLPGRVVGGRVLAGVLWGLLAFALGSVTLTRLLGWYPSLRNGFYHNRGTPWPRMLPGGK
jgi:hypothetical protein